MEHAISIFFDCALLIILALVCLAGLYSAIVTAVEKRRYKAGNNPYHRICKKCGSHQMMYESCFGTWWEEAHSGDDPTCPCHRDAETRDW